MINEMEVQDKENPPAENLPETESTKTGNSEMSEPCWSVVTYESVAISNLTYEEAAEWVRKLRSQKISGLCIVTDEAASRIREGNSN